MRSRDIRRWFLDINGDGLKDIVYIREASAEFVGDIQQLHVLFNSGQGFIPAAADRYLDGTVALPVQGEVLDYDGDGRDDLVTETGVFFFPQTGGRVSRFAPFETPLSIGAIADVNGDGSGDIFPDLSRGFTSIYLTNQARAGLLKKVVDGNGKQIEINYQAGQELADLGEPALTERTYDATGCVSDNTSFRNACLRRVAPLVSAHRESQINFVEQPGGAGTIISPGPSYKYRYTNARAGLDGRGWFGFHTRSIELEGLWRNSLFYRNTDFFFAGRVEVSLRSFINDASANRVTNATGRLEVSVYDWQAFEGDHVDFPFVASEVHDVREGALPTLLTRIQTERTPNTYGTVTSEETTTFTEEQEVASVTTTRVVDDDPDNWLLGRVTDVVTQARRGSSTPTTRRQHFEYYPSTQLLLSVEREPDPNNPGQPNSGRPTEYLKTTLDRSAFGNIRKACSVDARGTAFQRCAEVLQFDDDQIFPKIVRDADLLETEMLYSARNGQLLWVRDPNLLISQFAQDALGRPQQVRTPTAEGTISYFNTTMAFAPSGPSVTTRSAFGITETFRGQGPSTRIFDAFGRVVQERAPAFQGAPTSAIRTEFEYDPLGRLVAASLPHLNSDTSQGVVQYTYDEFGRKSSEVYPGNAAVKFYYPSRNNVVSAFAHLFAPIDMPSADDDLPASAVVVEKPRENLEITVADAHGNPVRTVQASMDGSLRSTTEYNYAAYDILGRIDSEGGSTHITSDSLGRPFSVADPAMGVQTYTYTGFDEIAVHTDGNMVSTEFSYDSKGRPTQIRDVTRNEIVAKWIYGQLDAAESLNERGRLLGAYRQARPGAGTGNWVRYAYQNDAGGIDRGLPASVEYSMGGSPDALGSGADRFQVGFDYQPEASAANPSAVPWRLNVLHYPAQGGSFGVQYGYDDVSGMVQEVRPAESPGANPYWQLLDTDQGFRPRQELLGNALITEREYYGIPTAVGDCALGSDTSCLPGALRGIATYHADDPSQRVQNVEYRYNRNGHVRSALTPDAPSRGRIYHYDELDRLKFDPAPDEPILQQSPHYQYDLAGNITSKRGIGAYTYDLPGKPFQVHHAGGTEHFYDNSGNLTERRGTSVPGTVQVFTYNQFNLPYKVTSGLETAASLTEFEYDGSGARLLKRRRGGITDDSPLAEVTTTIAELYEQVTQYTGGAPVATTHQYRIYAGGRQVAQVQRTAGSPEQTRYIHDDQLGSTSVLSDVAGNALETRRFTSFGEPQAVDFDQSRITSGYTGHQHDADLGLINMRGRIYDPRIGRFMTPDPFISGIDAAGLNRYSYVRNNPLNFVDPSGFQPTDGSVREGPPPETSSGGPQGSQISIPTPIIDMTPPEGYREGEGTMLVDIEITNTSYNVQTMWMPDEAARQARIAEGERQQAEAMSTPGYGAPTGRSGGSQEGPAITIGQPTNLPSGPTPDQWRGGDQGASSSSTPNPRLSQADRLSLSNMLFVSAPKPGMGALPGSGSGAASSALLPFNPVKGFVGMLNAVLGVRNVIVGVGVLTASKAAVAIPFVGEVVGPAAVALGLTKLGLGISNLSRGHSQFNEALNETSADATAKNFWGLVPFGQRFDDRAEPGPLDYASSTFRAYVADPIGATRRALLDFFAVKP